MLLSNLFEVRTSVFVPLNDRKRSYLESKLSEASDGIEKLQVFVIFYFFLFFLLFVILIIKLLFKQSNGVKNQVVATTLQDMPMANNDNVSDLLLFNFILEQI